jgi:hypothetical protein
MNQGAKVLLGVLGLGGIVALVVSSEKKAHASPAGAPPINPPLIPSVPPGGSTLPPAGGIVVVPPTPGPGGDPHPSAPPAIVVPDPISVLPGVPNLLNPTGVVPGAPTTTTITLPGIGTFNPATGDVFGPTGLIVGKFDPTTGKFTPTGGVPTPIVQPVLPVPTQVLPGITVTPGPAPTPAEPPASPAEQPSSVAPDTLAVLNTMLAQEHSPHWRIIPEPSLTAWQKSRGLTADGDFGTGTALKLAAETGMVPIIRGWPKGTTKQSPNLKTYQAALRTLAASAPEPRRSQLLAAALREQGQGYGTPETPITTLITLQDG